MAIRVGPVPNLEGSDPDTVFDSETIQKLTSKSYIMKKAAKYHRIHMSMYNSYFDNRQRRIVAEPTLLTDFFEQKSRATIEDLIAYTADSVTPENKFFLCRTIRPPWIKTEEITTGRLSNIFLVVEDPEGKKAVTIKLNRYPRRLLGDIIEEFPVGIVLAISNPRLMHQYTGSRIIFHFMNDSHAELKQENNKIGHLVIPSNEMIQKLYPNGLKWNSAISDEYNKFVVDIQFDYLLTSPNDWRKYGDVHFVRKYFDEAGIAYGKGLELDPKHVILLSSRARAYIKQQMYEQALNDAKKGLEIDPKHVIAAKRKAHALAGLELFEECADFIQKQMKIHPEVIDFRRLFDQANELNSFYHKNESIRMSISN